MSEPPCWRVWGQRPGQPSIGHQKNNKKPKGKKATCSRTRFWFARIAAHSSSSPRASRSSMRKKGSKTNPSAARTAAPTARRSAPAASAKCMTRSAQIAARPRRSRLCRATTGPFIAATASRTTGTDLPASRSWPAGRGKSNRTVWRRGSAAIPFPDGTRAPAFHNRSRLLNFKSPVLPLPNTR